ncbi:MAG: hypothetical protein KJ052_11035 [Candidatus Hydrogenedentes bacterium]|nr:hypothetical protein [Candidatus Hydrogenedentota bacterium]
MRRLLICGRLVCLLVGFLLLAGCAGGPPKPAKSIRQAKKAHKASDHETVLKEFEYIIDTAPGVLSRKRYQDEIDLYRDSQITYGLAQAEAAEQEGRLIDAWIYYVQLSKVDENREECAQAAESAIKTFQAISSDFLEKARTAEATGNRQEALVFAAQALWYGGGDDARALFLELQGGGIADIDLAVTDPVRAEDITGLVRTDSLDRLKEDPLFAPHGMPVYFGDVRRYYVSLGEVKTKGTPFTAPVPDAYKRYDSLAKLTKKATKLGADALINVHIWTKSKKAYTQAEMVKFVDLQ